MTVKLKNRKLVSSVASFGIVKKMLNNVYPVPFPLKDGNHKNTKVSSYLLDGKPGLLFCETFTDAVKYTNFVFAGSFCYRNRFHNAIWILEDIDGEISLLAKIESPAIHSLEAMNNIKHESSLIRSRMKKYMGILSSQGKETVWSVIKRDFPGWETTIY